VAEDPVPDNGKVSCLGDNLLPVPEDPSLPGPWPVGAMTLKGVSSRGLTVEVWYPATVGSERSRKNEIYGASSFFSLHFFLSSFVLLFCSFNVRELSESYDTDAETSNLDHRHSMIRYPRVPPQPLQEQHPRLGGRRPALRVLP
jgi:hypothetical protein